MLDYSLNYNNKWINVYSEERKIKASFELTLEMEDGTIASVDNALVLERKY